jgi:hypothetical protein
VQVGDELVLIACHLLRSIARWPASSGVPREQGLFEIACILECALEKSGFNFHMKLLLMQVSVADRSCASTQSNGIRLTCFVSQTYSGLAACEAAVKYYNDVEVKQIQVVLVRRCTLH